jgi:hypothetical protein
MELGKYYFRGSKLLANFVKFVTLDLCVLFGIFLKLLVDFCCDSSWVGNNTSQTFQPYMVCSVIHPKKSERHVLNQD